MNDHSELERLAEAATPGPWSYDGSYVCPARVEDGTTYVETWRSVADCAQLENTKFIAAANPAAVLALIADLENLRSNHEHVIALNHQQFGDAIRKNAECDQLKAENEALRNAAFEVLNWIEAKHRPPIADQFEHGRMALVRLHALAGLHAVMNKEG